MEFMFPLALAAEAAKDAHPTWLICLLGVSVVFVGLICIIGILYLMNFIIGLSEGKKTASADAPKASTVTPAPAQVAGALRPLVAQGKAANSKDGRGQTRYWMVNKQW